MEFKTARTKNSKSNDLSVPPEGTQLYRQVSVHGLSSKGEGEPKHSIKRTRTRGNSFYGRERPVFGGNNLCLHVNNCVLPQRSCSLLIKKGEKPENISGENIKHVCE